MRRLRVAGWLLGGATIAALALWATARVETESLTRPAVAPRADPVVRGAAAFEGAGFGGLSFATLASDAVPWRLVAAALVLAAQAGDPSLPANRATLDGVLARFGFLSDVTIVNLPEGIEAPHSALPLGFTTGDVAVGGVTLRVANLGCAACHAGVTYAADGRPQPHRAMLGMPNTSLDLEAYTLTVFRALRRFADSDRLLATADALFPEMGWRERQTLRFVALPLAKRRLATLAGADRPFAYPNGSPGSTNGVAALKAALGAPLIGGGAAETGVVSIPDLGNRVWKSSLLVDGAYAPPGVPRQASSTQATVTPAHLDALAAIMTFFTVPSMGVHPDAALASLDDATDIMAFLQAYRPQPFPGPLDRAVVARGHDVYAQSCAGCHGDYDADPKAPHLVRFPNWIGDVGTDRKRDEVFDTELAAAVAKTAYRSKIAVVPGHGYVAPPLTGVWASAPYLHDSSVPTLAALLSPETRPQRFMVGGHALDFEAVGLKIDASGAYPSGYRPFSVPAWLDTRAPGHGNQGHDYGHALSPNDKRALLEYLKLL